MNYDVAQKRKFNFATWRLLWPFFRPVRGHMIAAISFIALSAGLDVTIPLFLRYAVDVFILPQTTEGLGLFTVLYLIVLVLQAVATILFFRFTMIVEMEMGRQMKTACFTHLQTLSLTYYNQTPVGYILARVMSDTDRISSIVAWGLITFFWGLFYLIGMMIALFALDFRLALIMMGIIPIVLAITVLIKNRLLQANRNIRSVNAKVTGMYNEGITGAKTTKTLVIEDKLADEFSHVAREFYHASLRSTRLNALFLPLVVFVGAIAAAIGLYYGGILVMNQVLAFGTLSVFISYALVVVEPIQDVSRLFSDFLAGQVNVERVVDLLNQDPRITDTPEVIAKYGDVFSAKRKDWESTSGDIRFDRVWFQYPDGDEYVLEDFSLHIPAGTTVAIVGKTGAGKSTLVNLACRFLEPTRGQVLFDGVDYRERSLLWLQSRLGYVLQNPHLFSGTVMENIRYGRLDATDEEVIAAAKLVSVDKVVEKLEHGYHTDVGEGGDRLSTGEKQLVSFARALLADPPIFVLDEATSSIDTETETLIQHAISHVLKGRTSFIIAHRLSTIRQADLILMVEDGKIIERGAHDALMAAEGAYFALYTAMLRTDS